MQTIWIELPALDIERARDFYATVFGHEPTPVNDDGTRAMTVNPGLPTVSLNQTAGFEPGAHGPLPVFDLDEPLSPVVQRALAAGARVVEPLNQRGEYGWFALLRDTEGNHVYLHSSAR